MPDQIGLKFNIKGDIMSNESTNILHSNKRSRAFHDHERKFLVEEYIKAGLQPYPIWGLKEFISERVDNDVIHEAYFGKYGALRTQEGFVSKWIGRNGWKDTQAFITDVDKKTDPKYLRHDTRFNKSVIKDYHNWPSDPQDWGTGKSRNIKSNFGKFFVPSPLYHIGIKGTGTKFQDGYLIVIDIDVKNGVDGLTDLKEICKQNNINFEDAFPPTMIVKTPSGGFHYYYKTTKKFSQLVKGISPGVDIVLQTVAPGSYKLSEESKPYVLLTGLKISNLSDFMFKLIDEVQRKKDEQIALRAKETSDHISSLLPADKLKRAKKYLAKMAPSVEGQNGSRDCFKAACVAIKGFDLQLTEALEALEDWNSRCSPPWSKDELIHKCEDAAKADGAWGYLIKVKSPKLKLNVKDLAGKVILPRDDEVAISNHFIQTLGENVVFTENRLYKYNGQIYTEIDTQEQVSMMKTFAGLPTIINLDGDTAPLRLSKNRINGAIHLAINDTKLYKSDFFKRTATGVIAFTNGILVNKEGKFVLEAFDPKYGIRSQYDFDYISDPHCPRWMNFLNGLFEHDNDVTQKIQALQELIGISLVGLATRYKKAGIFVGDTNSAKSTLIQIIRSLFPSNTVSGVEPKLLNVEYYRANLVGKLLNTIAELPSMDMEDTGEFKKFVAGDLISAREPCGKPFEYDAIAGHIYGVNILPRILDKSKATLERMLIIEFNNTFHLDEKPNSKNPRDKIAIVGLADRIIESEKSKIITWAIQGAERLIRNSRYTLPLSHTSRLAAWSIDSNPIEQFFNDNLIYVNGSKIGSQSMYNRYAAWCKVCGYKPLAINNFTTAFRKLISDRLSVAIEDVQKEDRNHRRWYMDLKFIDDSNIWDISDYERILS